MVEFDQRIQLDIQIRDAFKINKAYFETEAKKRRGEVAKAQILLIADLKDSKQEGDLQSQV